MNTPAKDCNSLHLTSRSTYYHYRALDKNYMNWDNSEQWKRDLEMFEQSKRIADSLERIANYLAVPHKPRQVVMKEVIMTPKEEELLNNLHNNG